MIELIGESFIKSKINHEDFILMHKAELKSIINNNEIFGVFTFWFDRVGMIIIGVIIDSFIQNTFSLSTYGTYLVVGVIFGALGFYYSLKKEKNIKTALNEKLAKADTNESLLGASSHDDR